MPFCAAGSDCKFPDLVLAGRHVCPDCSEELHGLCGIEDDDAPADKRVVCPDCHTRRYAKMPGIPAKEDIDVATKQMKRSSKIVATSNAGEEEQCPQSHLAQGQLRNSLPRATKIPPAASPNKQSTSRKKYRKRSGWVRRALFVGGTDYRRNENPRQTSRKVRERQHLAAFLEYKICVVELFPRRNQGGLLQPLFREACDRKWYSHYPSCAPRAGKASGDMEEFGCCIKECA